MVCRPEPDRLLDLNNVLWYGEVGVQETLPFPAAGVRWQGNFLPLPVGIEQHVEIGPPVPAVKLKSQRGLLSRPVRLSEPGPVPADTVDELLWAEGEVLLAQ